MTHQIYLYVKKSTDPEYFSILRKHKVEILEDENHLSIWFPEGTKLIKTIQKQDSLPEAGISSKMEEQHYLLPSQLPVIFRKEMVITPRELRTTFTIIVDIKVALSLSS